MIKVEHWITESREIRTAHIDMNEPCIERGGNSTVHRGILAQYLGTDLPDRVDLCHNCGNGKCSNPKHLYWGTRKENIEDAKRHGTWKSPWQRLVEKYGYEEACRRNSRSSEVAARGGKAGKGKILSEEHKRNISLNHKGGKIKGWRKDRSMAT